MKHVNWWFLSALLLVGVASADTLNDEIEQWGSASAWELKYNTASRVVAGLRDYEDVTAANTLAYNECGKTSFLNATAEFASTLPAPEAGCSFKFIVKAAPVGTAYTIVTNGGANIINGPAVVNGASVTCANEDTITFTAGAAIAGDWVEVVSDGTSWFLRGTAHAATGIACSAT